MISTQFERDLKDAVRAIPGLEKSDRVIVVDDLIASGGTAEGAIKHLRHLGAQVLACCFNHRFARPRQRR